MKTPALILLVTVLSAAVPLAQEGRTPQTDAQAAAMMKLAFMSGTWQGDGWIQRGAPRQTFHGQEVVQPKLDGLTLLVEGHFLGRLPGAQRDVPVHTTLGVIWFDVQTATYKFQYWLATGGTGTTTLTVEGRGWRWELRAPQGIIRYSMSLTDSGEWAEVGDLVREGAPPLRFFEMRLRRVGG